MAEEKETLSDWFSCTCECCVSKERVIKDYISKIKDRIVENDIYTADEIFRIINETVGKKLR